MDKRFALAFALSLLVWIIWFVVFKPVPEPQRVVQETDRVQQEKADDKGAVQRPAEEVRTSAAFRGTHAGMTAGEEVSIPVMTDHYQVRLSNRGALINSLVYLYNGRKIEMVVERDHLKQYGIKAGGEIMMNSYFSDGEFLDGSPLDNVLWQHQRISENSVRFYSQLRTEQGTPLLVEKIYTFHKDKFYFTIEQTIKNRGNSPVSLPGNSFIASTSDFMGPSMDFDNSYNRVQSIFHLDGDFERGSQGGGIFSSEKDIQRLSGDVRWVGVMSRYFLMLLVPQNFTGTGVIHEGRAHHGARTGMYVPVNEIQAGGEVTRVFNVYVGEKDKEKLAGIDPVLASAADVNAFIEPIRDFLLWCLFHINLLLGNFGWSLVVFSIITKILLMPLTIKSMDSMRRMQELSPKIKEIQAKYKEKPEVMNKKVMELYKKEKVNPLSGCLPLLLQMPFFFALYSALINSVDLWHAPFIFWIRDLSMPDTVATISGFNINILPLVMTFTTFLQQKMTPGSDSSQQQMFLKLMPLIFLFIFWNMPSGLIIYWIMQNVLQVLHQLYINNKAKKGVSA